MRVSLLLTLPLLFGLFGDTGAERGREGNTLFEQGRFAEAEQVYRDGLAALTDTTGTVYVALQNNLGAVLLRQKTFSSARTAFERARRAAPSDTGRVQALFNEGTAAARQDDISTALDRYRRVLLADPSREAARHNYELLRRRQSEDRQPPSRESIEPSAYARRLKKKAEALVARTNYQKAAALMRDGLQRDSTVRAYRDFITRIDEIHQIAQSP